jgi:transcriptional regulator with XRE-family HTH domain
MLKENLINLLEQKNISLTELARQTKVPKSNLSAWLKGRSPNVEQLDKVAQFLDTTIDFLMFGRKAKREESTLVYKLEVESGKYEIVVKKIT